MVQSIEKRRRKLLAQAEGECQKDLKQIWADKVFHESTVSQFDAALALASKAHKCTSDVEMILTALQTIRQLSKLKEINWDASAFTTMVSSPGIITEGMAMEANKAGRIKRASLDDVVVQNLPAAAKLGENITFKVTRNLLDGRSKQNVCLQNVSVITAARVKVLVNYGHAQKSHKNVSISNDPQSDGTCVVTLRLVCGGKHTIEVKYGRKEVKGSPFSLNVSGKPEVGARVKKGPDWKNSGWSNLSEGTVQRMQATRRGYYGFQSKGDQGATSLSVYWNNGYAYNHIWGGPYEIELV